MEATGFSAVTVGVQVDPRQRLVGYGVGSHVRLVLTDSFGCHSRNRECWWMCTLGCSDSGPGPSDSTSYSLRRSTTSVRPSSSNRSMSAAE